MKPTQTANTSRLSRFLSQTTPRSFSSLVMLVLGIRCWGAIGNCLAPISSPHTWRQVDTMATALRYARRWTIETTDFSWWIPAVLNSQNTRGIMAMEFPAVNMLGALGFVTAGSHIDLGRIFAQILLTLTVGGLIYVAGSAWLKNDSSDQPGRFVTMAWFAACCSFSTPFTAKFMPDTTAMLLALIGTAGIWRFRWWGVACLALGILIKPTAAVVVALLLLHPRTFRAWLKQFPLVLLAVVPAAGWYLEVTKYLKSLQEIPSLFELFANRDSLGWLKKFWLSPDIWDLIHFHIVFEAGWILILIALLFSKERERKITILKLLGIAVVQASIVGTLSGDHARLHAYYLAGLAPTAALLMYETWYAMPWAFGRWVLALGILIHSGETAVADMSGIWSKSQASALFQECRDLRTKVPDAPWNQGQVWRTPMEEYPVIDLCLGERGQSSIGEWGVFRQRDKVKIPSECHEVAATENLMMVRCVQ